MGGREAVRARLSDLPAIECWAQGTKADEPQVDSERDPSVVRPFARDTEYLRAIVLFILCHSTVVSTIIGEARQARGGRT